MKKLWLALFFTFAFAAATHAQESSCGDGVDNDGDGFIDCFDSDCKGNVLCKDFYIGQDKDCQSPPTFVQPFSMKLETSSANRTVTTSGRFDVGDLDSDGIPEVITVNTTDKKLYILNGTDLSTKYSSNVKGAPEYYDHAIGDVNKDGCAEIFIAELQGGQFYITCYDCKGVKQWSVPAYDEPFDLGLADFGSDGKPELYYKNEILDAATGDRLVKGSGSWLTIDSGPVAVDMLTTTDCASCSGLELALGGTIYSVNLGARTVDAGTLTLVRNIPAAANYFPKKSTFGYVTSQTSVADYNQDGFLDILTSGSITSSTGTTTAFFWDVHNGTYKTFAPSTNWVHGTGRLNIADIDGDGKLNTTFVSGGKIFALKEDFTELWELAINESTSGFTGATVFDFNNDKSNEIVYRDEQYLYIIDGKTGTISTKNVCKSRTANEYPVVVDVDADGATEICVACATNDNDDINDVSLRPLGQIRTYSSNAGPWVPARKVWNQHAYFNVNINDDLTIPKVQQLHHKVFSVGSPCNPGSNRPLNTFLNQSPYLDSKGCPTYAAPDLVFDPASTITINTPTCPDQDFTVSFTIKNTGDLGLSGTLPITFYSGNPTQAGAIKLNTVNINVTSLDINDTFASGTLTVNGTGKIFTLFMVLNDNGTTIPTPIKLPNSTFHECDYTNNFASASINPKPFAIETALISDNIKCATTITSPNGAVQSYRLVSGVQETVNYSFYWFNSAVVGDTTTAAYRGPVYSGLTEGTYSVFAVHKGFLCSSSSKSIVVGVQARTLNLNVIADKPYTSCKNPDGKMHVEVNGGDPAGNFTYEWYAGPDVLSGIILSKSHVLTNVDGSQYTVLVTEKLTQCQALKSGNVADLTLASRPTVSTTTTDANCVPANSGSASANVNNVTTGFTFKWYIGNSLKPVPDTTSVTYLKLPVGSYSVTATDNSTGCTSPLVTTTVKSKQIQAVTTAVTSQQTSCRSTTPNGAASANVAGITAGFTWKWFKGNNTLPANLIVGANSSSISGLAAGVYTAQATDVGGCTDSKIVTIVDNITLPTVSTSINSQQINCLPANGSLTAVAASTTGPFKYYWFNGNVGTPDTTASNFKGATYTGVVAGFYTVVAVDKITRCASARDIKQVLDQTVSPTITTSITNQTSCNAASPNGGASASVTIPVGTYKFRWWKGSDTTIVANFIIQASSISNLPAGTDIVKAVNTSTGCFSTKLVTISDAKVLPALTLAATPNSVCNPLLTSPAVTFNGSVAATVTNQVGAITNYTFAFGGGPGVQGISPSHNSYNQLNGGITYTATATHTVTGCVSTLSSVQVLNVQTLPTLTTGNTPSTNCMVGKEDGKATVVTVNGSPAVAAGFTYAWTGPIAPAFPVTPAVNSSNTLQLIKVQGGTGYSYTVLVTDQSNGCANTAVVNVADARVLPTLTLAPSANSVCDPLLTSPAVPYNGNVTATVTNQVGALTNYTFAFGGGAGLAGASPAHNVFSQLNGGITYTVTGTHALTGCSSTLVSAFVANNFTYPVLLTGANASTNCIAGKENGTANVTQVDGLVVGVNPAALTDYTYQWYDGNTVIPANIKAAQTNPTLGSTVPGAGIQGGGASIFTALVTHKTNGCQTNSVVTIPDGKVNPVVSASLVQNNTMCIGQNGSLKATVTYQGVTQASPLAANWKVTWNTIPVTVPTLGEIDTGLLAGTYSASVTDSNTGCTSSASIGTVVNQFDMPLITTTVLSKQTSCDVSAPNGKLQGSATNGPALSTLRFAWYDGIGTALPATPLGAAVTGNASGGNLQTAGNLPSKNYTFEAKNEVTGCISTSTILLPQQLTYPTFTGGITDVTSCVPSNGQLDIALVTISNPAKFTIYYLDEVNSAQTGNPAVVKASATASFTDDPTKLTYTGIVPAHKLIPGTYTVLVRDGVTTCESTPVTYTVNDNTVKTVTASLTSSASTCSLGLGGKLDLTVNPVGAYTYSWHSGVPTNNSFNFMNNANVPVFAGGDPVTQTTEDLTGFVNGNFLGVSTGIYSVVVTDAVGCGKVFSDNIPFSGSPKIVLSLTNSSKCDPSLSDAQIQVTVSPDPLTIPGSTYSIRLFTTHNSTTGVYANGEDDNCSDGIDNDGDGSIDMADSDCGITNASALFTNTSALLTGSASRLFGDYLVRVYDNASGCAIEKVVTLIAAPKLPLVTSTLTANTACAGGVGDGTVKLTVNKDPSDTTTPTYQVTNISPANISGVVNQVMPQGVPTFVTGTFDAIPYTLTISDAASGCSVDQFVNIPSQPGIPTAFTITPSDDEFCAPLTSGSALVTTLTTVAPSTFTDFKFEWYKDNALSIPVAPIAFGDGTNTGGELLTSAEVIAFAPANWPINATAGLGNGSKTFYARAQKQNAPGEKCYSSIQQITISDTHIAPQLTLLPFSNTSCNAAAPEGKIDITASTASSNGAISSSPYTYSWTPVTAGTPATGQNGAVTYSIGNLLTNTFTVTALNETSKCITSNSVDVSNTKFNIAVTDKLIADQVICPVGGQVDVTEIQIDRSITGQPTLTLSGATLASDFTYQWFKAPVGNPGSFNSATPLQDNSPATISIGSLVTGVGAQQYSAMGEGNYYVIATRTNSVTLPGNMCASQPFRVDVADKRQFPTLAFASLASTSCNTNYDGSITVTASTTGFGPGTLYNFDWTSNPVGTVITDGPVGGAVSPQVNKSEALGGPVGEKIGQGPYQITVTNISNNCQRTGTIDVQQNVVPVEVITSTFSPLTKCPAGLVLPDGSVSVTSVEVNHVATGLGNFSFGWTGPGGPYATTTVSNLMPGDYFITATKNVAAPVSATTPASGCASAPFKVSVLDERVYPTVSFTTISSNTCDANFNGQITVTATTASGPGAGKNYNFVWTNDPDGLAGPLFSATNSPTNNTPSPFSTLATDRIGLGPYDITVTNFTTNCSTNASVNVLKNTPTLEILSVSKTDKSDCAPLNGNITVNPATDLSVAGTYTFTWTMGGSAIPPPGPVPDNVLDKIDSGRYTVTGLKSGGIGSGCSTAPFPVKILDLTIKPAIDIAVLKENLGCIPLTFNGKLSGSVSEGTTPGVIAGYSFEWFTGKNNTNPVNSIGTANPISSLNGGSNYTLYVKDLNSPSKNCDNQASVFLNNITTVLSSRISTSDQTFCFPKDGRVAVSTIDQIQGGTTTTFDMTKVDSAQFQFQWFDSSNTPLAPYTKMSGLTSGTYYVQITNISLGCPVPAVPSAGIVKNLTTNPVVSVSDFRNPAICILPAVTGMVNVVADGNTNPGNYTFNWYSGNAAVGAPVSTNSQLDNILYTDPKTYTTRVSDNTTKCFSDVTYVFKTDTVTIHTIASAIALTSCAKPNGSLFSTTTQGNGNQYKYEWFAGPVVNSSPIYFTQEVTSVPLGLYTVRAKNPSFTFCKIIPDTARVTNDQRFPVVHIVPLAPLTYCDPSKANGAAKADVNGNVYSYKFDWLEGSQTGPVYDSGSEANNLKNLTYFVRATDLISKCPGFGSIKIENAPIIIPAPTLEILSNRTDCQTPNGALSATVNGQTQDYVFQWYNGSTVKSIRDALGEIYRDIDAGPYTATATDRVSGCTSAPATETILEILALPEFKVKASASSCDEDNTGGTGAAEIIILNSSDIASVEWFINGITISQQGSVSGLSASNADNDYSVTATSSMNCKTTVNFTIKTDINIYNAVSKNGDNKNDIFEIGCIAKYPNNTVKIFNRTGTLVYENKGYDNGEGSFNGTSNKGINILGTDLPDGTYFYIINKGDNSDPKTGYLELLRN